MNPDPNQQKTNRVTFKQSTEHVSWRPNLTGLRQSEREAYQFILEFLEEEDMSEFDKLTFLRAVDTLSGAVRAQASGTMDEYLPKTTLAKKIETFILEEASEVLTSNVRQQAMLCVVALSQVDPPFYLAQKLDLANVSISRVFSLPSILPSQDRKDSASLYLQTVQALDDMLQALVMDGLEPDMAMLQRVLEIVLPWLTMSEREQEQTRAADTISHLLRFICNFPELLHMAQFTVSGRLMGTLGLFCMNPTSSVSMRASEGLHYLFKVLVLHRSMKQKTESILRNLQKHFRGEWLVYLQDLTMFFEKFLTPEERADVIMVFMEAMASASEDDVRAASRVLRMILKSSMPEIGKVPEIVRYICHNMNSITEAAAQETMRKLLQVLAQAYTEDVILTLFKMQDQSPSGVHKPWEFLASFPKSYEVIMDYLLQKLMVHLRPGDPEPGDRTRLSTLIATRAIHELLLEPCRRTEVQTMFSPLFLALLFQTSFLVVDGGAEPAQDQQGAEWMDPVSTTVQALKTLMSSAGYGDHVSYVQRLGGWELLTSPENHHTGVTLLARAMVIKSCWHGRPVFNFLIRLLQGPDHGNHVTAFVFMAELLRCPHVAATVDDATVFVLASWFQREEPATVKLLLRVVETLALHESMTRQLCLLQPYVLHCCYSLDRDIVTETFLVLRSVAGHLTWPKSSSLLVQLTFTLRPFFEEESEHLRLMAFEIYGTVLAKVRRRLLFPLRHQVLNLLVPLVLHLLDRNFSVAQTCRLALCHTATILGWSKLKAAFADKDVWTILRVLLERQAGRALWFLQQCVTLFKSGQAPIRQAAVWFAGQIIQTLDVDEAGEVEEARAALRSMRGDPDPMVSCLATQTMYVIDTKESLPVRTPSCFCGRCLRKSRL